MTMPQSNQVASHSVDRATFGNLYAGYDAFADGWEVESVRPAQVEENPDFADIKFSEGGPKAWFAVVRRQG